MPLVSIIVPIYGVEACIERCAVSLFEQTFYDIEYIFVNDCSTDQSFPILTQIFDKYPARKNQVRIITHKENKGLSASRNTGLRHASCDFIIHIDSDDFIENDYVELLLKRQRETNADIVFTGRNFVYADITKSIFLRNYEDIEKWRVDLLVGKFPHTVWGCLITKDLYVKNQITSIEGLHQGEDFAVMARLAYYVKKISIVDKALYNYLIRTNIYQFNENIVQDTYTSWDIVNKFYYSKKDYYKYEESLNLRLFSFYSWQIMCWACNNKCDRESAEFIARTFCNVVYSQNISIKKYIPVILFESRRYKLSTIYAKLYLIIQRLIKRRGREL